MWKIVLENLIPMFFAIITPVVTTVIFMGMNKLAKKWKLDWMASYDSTVEGLVMRGIKAVEQKSLAAVRSGAEKTPNQKKLDEAMKFVIEQLNARKLPQKASDELSMMIEAKLFDLKHAPQLASASEPKA